VPTVDDGQVHGEIERLVAEEQDRADVRPAEVVERHEQ
jgi:hypothetical protein